MEGGAVGHNFERDPPRDHFLTYITGFFMNFELLLILTDYAN
jgi:hypothetical protein